MKKFKFICIKVDLYTMTEVFHTIVKKRIDSDIFACYNADV